MSSWFSIISSGVVLPADDPQWNSTIPPAMKRKDPRIWQMAHIATRRALAESSIQCKSIISGTALGALDETKNFLDGIFGEGFGSPRNFIASVHNSMAGKLALDFKIEGPNLTVCDGHNSMASALSIASLLQYHEFPALLLLIDERIALFDVIHDHLSAPCKQFIEYQWKEAAVALILDRNQSAKGPKIRGFGPCNVHEQTPEEHCRNLGATSVDQFANCDFSFNKSSVSYIQPALEIHTQLSSGGKKHAVIGSYSPASNGVALVEYIP